MLFGKLSLTGLKNNESILPQKMASFDKDCWKQPNKACGGERLPLLEIIFVAVLYKF